MSLRWALFHEGTLKFNSNLRLFTSAKTCPANRAPVNYTSLVLLVISYTGASQSVSHRNGSMSFGGIALLLLGAGLLGQVSISAYCLYGKIGRRILSWSASPLNTALACLHHGLYTRRPGRGMMGVESKGLPSGPQRPQRRQPSMRKPCGATFNIVYFLFFLAFLTIVLAVTIYTLCVHLNRVQYYSFFNDGAPGGDRGEVSTTGISVGIQTSYVLLPQLLVFLFGLAMQSIITFALHCAELVVNVSRDEGSWRAAAEPAGTALGDGAAKSARTSLAWLFLFVLKPVLQWLFGAQGISYSNNHGGSIEFNPVPLFVLAGVATLLAVFATCLVCRKQSGPQPAAYGDLQTLVDCIDDWGQGDTGRLWWGYKGLGAGRVGVVGTSGMQGEVWPVSFDRTYQ